MSDSRVVLVTGASAGIGKAIVRRLLDDGWIVYGAARRVPKMQDIQAEGAKILRLDVTDDESMQAAIDGILEAEGRVDALVNNAGYGAYGPLEEVPIDDARRQFEVNVFGAMRLAQLVLPAMREQGSGTIVNMSSMGGRIWTPMGGWYHATKHALEVLSDSLRVETKPFGIDVVVVQPGVIETEWSGIAADHLERAAEGSPYRPMAESMAETLRDPPTSAPPTVVARAVAKALGARNPRRRYATPFDAKLLIFLRQWLPDWAWDFLAVRVI